MHFRTMINFETFLYSRLCLSTELIVFDYVCTLIIALLESYEPVNGSTNKYIVKKIPGWLGSDEH